MESQNVENTKLLSYNCEIVGGGRVERPVVCVCSISWAFRMIPWGWGGVRSAGWVVGGGEVGGWVGGIMTSVLVAAMPKTPVFAAFFRQHTGFQNKTSCHKPACLPLTCPKHWHLQRCGIFVHHDAQGHSDGNDDNDDDDDDDDGDNTHANNDKRVSSLGGRFL